MPQYVIFSLLAAVSFAISSLLNKLTSKHSINNKNSLMALFLIFSFILGLLLFPFINISFPPIQAIKPLIINTLTFSFGYYLFYNGIFSTDASSFAPLFQLQSGLIAVLAFLFLGERFPSADYLWLGLLFIGAIIVTVDESMSLKSFLKRGVLSILAMQLLHAISNLFVGITLKYLTPVEILFWQYLILGFLFTPFYLITKPRLRYSVKKLSPLFLASTLSSLGAIFLFKAFTSNLTISSTIAMLSTPLIFVISVIASKFFPQLLEQHSRKVYLVRSIGLAFILLGAYKITF